MAQRLLESQVAVVTGAARGIGLGVAHRFAEEGASVVLADVDVETAASAARSIADATGARAASMALNVADPESVQAAVAAVREDFGGADCVVANAGILHLRPELEMELKDWQRVIDINLTGAFLTCRDFARDMVDRQASGRIIITSSLFGRRGGVENAAYSATKFGVLGLMECLAAELAPSHILVNAVCPGQIDTEMNRKLLHDRSALTGADPETVLDRLVSKVAMGRLGSVEEVADAFVYFASPLSRYVTGQALVVDGGWEVG